MDREASEEIAGLFLDLDVEADAEPESGADTARRSRPVNKIRQHTA
jgi:hypothetical protein